MTKEHYGCESAPGALFENEGGAGSIAAHWERSMFYNEIMNPSGI